MTVTPRAIEVYEDLRNQVLADGRGPTELTALLYHGMVRGLTLLATPPRRPSSEPECPVRTTLPAVENDPNLVRLLANMVLHIQSEVQHVY